MELKYQVILYIGIAVIFFLILLRLPKRDAFQGGKKVTGVSHMEEDPYFQKKWRQYKVLSTLLYVFLIMDIALCFLLLARPCKTETTQEEKYSRDIILCMDVSTSVDQLNIELVEELKETVSKLQGERFGIVIFNTSATMLSPLTDDYTYILDVLDQVETALKGRSVEDMDDEDYLYMMYYLTEGTLVGNEERGSSLIGDGLVSAVYDFPDLEEDPDRTRVVLLSTDNDLQGDPLVTLDEAAHICEKNNVVVYGIGTNEMKENAKQEMRRAVEQTGGNFYLEEDAGNVKTIVKEIEKKGKSLVKVEKETRKVEKIELPVILLTLVSFLVVLLTKISKR